MTGNKKTTSNLVKPTGKKAAGRRRTLIPCELKKRLGMQNTPTTTKGVPKSLSLNPVDFKGF